MSFFVSGKTQRHGHGVGEIPVATPDEVSLQDNTANIGDFARYSLVKAHGKYTYMCDKLSNVYVDPSEVYCHKSFFHLHLGIIKLVSSPDFWSM